MAPVTETIRKSAIVVLAIALAAILFKRTVSPESARNLLPIPMNPSRVTLLAEGACTPGKVIKAVRDGKVVGSYTCTAQDSAAVWLSAVDSSGNPSVSYVNEATDAKGGSYQKVVTQFRGLVLCRILAGYAVRPPHLDLHCPVSSTADTLIPITQLAPPARQLKMPSPGAEKEITVALDRRGFARAEVHPSMEELKASGETAVATITGTDFCPEGPEVPDLRAYGRDTELVKVRLNTYRYVESTSVLTYKDATVATINGERVLHLPTRQMVGSVEGLKAYVGKRVVMPIGASRGLYRALIWLQFGRSESDEEVATTVSFDSISPSADEIGIDPLRIRLGGDFYGADLKPNAAYKGRLASDIPELKISVRIKRPVMISSKSYVVPLHHIERVHQAITVSAPQIQAGPGLMMPPVSISPAATLPPVSGHNYGHPDPELPLYIGRHYVERLWLE